MIERPKMREIWERKLFKRVYWKIIINFKILSEVKSKNLTIERLFYFIDINNDGEISPGELREGKSMILY